MKRVLLPKVGLLFAFLYVALVGNGCGTTVGTYLTIQGTPPDSGYTAFKGRGTMSRTSVTISVKDTTGAHIGDLTLTSARLGLSEIKFDMQDAPSDSGESQFQGPYIVDLLANSISPSLGTQVITPGIYDQIRLKLDKIETGDTDATGAPLLGATDPLLDNSIYLEGTYTGTTASGPVTDASFSLTFDLDENFELNAPDVANGFSVTGTGETIIIAFRLISWFAFEDTSVNDKGVDLSDVTLSSGAIVLDKNSAGTNQDIRSVIRSAIKASAKFGRDADGDGELSDGEDEDGD